MTEKVSGCVHLVVKNGKVLNVFTHLDKLPKEGVVHLKGDKIFSFDEFATSHPLDVAELKEHNEGIFISSFLLPSKVEKLLAKKKDIDENINGFLQHIDKKSLDVLPSNLKRMVIDRQAVLKELDLVRKEL